MNKLFFGDNIDVLREHVSDASVDLVYLDPPFNSSLGYNAFFLEQGGARSDAQVEIFRDTWRWGESAEESFDDVMRQGGELSSVLRALRTAFGQSSMMAYLAMMAARLVELHRTLKDTGTIYLHCDPTASHYLKVVMDSVFGPGNFLNEVIWKRTSAHSAARRWGDVHDSILVYARGPDYVWNEVFTPYDDSYVARYKRRDDDGRVWADDNLTAPGVRNGHSGANWKGFDPTIKGNHWKVSNKAVAELVGPLAAEGMTTVDKLEVLDGAGLIYWPPSGGFPRFKRVLGRGMPLQDVITDISPLNSQARERLHYPTQKPLALLDRLIRASSSKGGVVLDPFCGCGTTIEAAEANGRQWIGIDVAHYAISLIEARLAGSGKQVAYSVEGRPTTLDGARELAKRDKYQFQMWAAWKLGAQSYREIKKGPDRGIDGRIQFKNGAHGWGQIIISVKGGDNVGVAAVRDLRGVVEREAAEMGVLVTLASPTGQMTAEALSARFVERSAHGRLPKLQIVTAEDIIDGRFPKLPPLPQLEEQRKSSRAKKPSKQLELLLPLAEAMPGPKRGEVVDPRYMDLAV